MAVTTSEELQKLLTVIYGYAGQKTGIEAGEFIGPSRLAAHKVMELTKEFVGYLQAFNGMLRDYAGAEIYAMEFDLVSFTPEHADTRLYPKSMVLIPGKFKDAENLLVALRAEQAGLDMSLASQDLNTFCSRCWEIEEVSDLPNLETEAKAQVLSKFAQRFARHIQGLLIEGKWNKKLIGLKGQDATDDEHLSEISSVKAKKTIRWVATTPEIEMSSPLFSLNVPDLRPEKQIDFFKIMISGPSAYFIAQNTFKLAANLLQVANIGSINDNQAQVIQLTLKIILRDLGKQVQDLGPVDTIAAVNEGLNKFFGLLDEFQSIGVNFTQEGIKGSFQDVLIECAKFFGEQQLSDKVLIRKILDVFIDSCKQGTGCQLQDQIRSSDLKTDLDFFSESTKHGLKLVRDNLYRYFSLLIHREFKDQFVNAVRDMLEIEATPAKALGLKFLEKISKILDGEIAYEHFFHISGNEIPFADLGTNFSTLIKENLPKYLEEVDVSIADLLAFAESLVEDGTESIQEHLEKLAKFEQQIEFIYAYILRYSSINRFVNEFENQFHDPATFGDKFYEFLRKRISGAMTSGLTWATHVLEWIHEYRDIHSSKLDTRIWEKGKIIEDFLKFVGEKVKKAALPAEFVYVMDKYITQLPPGPQTELLTQLMGKFEENLGIKESFPQYMQDKIMELVDSMQFNFLDRSPASYFQDEEHQLFYEFLENHALKHFARLQSLPKNMILRSMNDLVEDKEIYHVLEFQYMPKRLKIDVKSNWEAMARLIR
ncbi:MAG TPA: hypothetical protein VKK79_19915 [Candidatus Lokiarchaeia archaeon]|nr:hypothetical protein [Candidatus Lokiarchaeia archaeon]